MKDKNFKINIKLANNGLYILIIIGILILVGIGVYAYGTSDPPVFGHTINEVAPPSPCSANQFLKFSNASWICSDICPSGTHIVASGYTNGVEDVYGTTTSYSYPCSGLPTDTCNGVWTTAYTCLVDESRTCTDTNRVPTGGIAPYLCTSRTITCRRAAMLCGE